jgi:predicted RNA-binding protein with PUA-like domain
MAYWLVKSEPETWSWDQHVKKGADQWTGVRNFQARTHLKNMKKGDKVFFYHTGDEKAVVGVSEVVKEAYPDPTDKEGAFVSVDLKAVEPLKTPVTLAAIKADKKFADMVLVKAARLSVQPVTSAEWSAIRKLGGLK